MAQHANIPADRVLKKLDELLGKNDYTAAKNHLLYWLDEAKAAFDDNAILLLYNELMGLCRKLSQEQQALFFAESALEQIENMNIKANVGAATTYLNCATVYKAFSKSADAILLFQKAKSIYEENLSPDDDRLGGLYNNMGLALVDLRRFDEAMNLYRQALSVMSRVEGREPEAAITYLNMASAAEAQFGIEGAEASISEYIEKAINLLDKGKDRLDGNYAFVCEKCATVFGYYGYFEYENQLKERYGRIYEGA